MPSSPRRRSDGRHLPRIPTLRCGQSWKNARCRAVGIKAADSVRTRDSRLALPSGSIGKRSTKNEGSQRLYLVEGGDHSLVVTKGQLKANGETQDHVEERIV